LGFHFLERHSGCSGPIEQRIGDVLLNRDRVEQSAFLKQHSHAAANMEQLRFFETGDLLVEQINLPESGRISPMAALSSVVLPLPAAPSTDARVAGVHFERDRIERDDFIEVQAYVVEPQEGIHGPGGWAERSSHSSLISVQIHENTRQQGGDHEDPDRGGDHGFGGGQPTPCVPPVVRSP
jgi:hypothetical protein